MTPGELAAIHALCFRDAPRPWGASEFADLLGQAGVLLATRPGGLAMGRVAGPEAEILTIAVVPEARRHGLGRTLLAEIEAACASYGAEVVFLEVAETNLAARRLYQVAGYAQAGFRHDYYTAAGRRRVGALVLRKTLGGRDAAAGAPAEK